MKFDLSQDFSGRRCTKRDEYGNADIKGVDMQFMLGLDYEQMNTMQIALNRLADFEDAQTHGKRTETHGVCSDELISREAAIDALKENMVEMGGDDWCEIGVHKDDIEAIINALPSAEPKTGKWIEESDNYGHSSYFCSRCGTQEGEPSGFCPNCGADMRGESDD